VIAYNVGLVVDSLSQAAAGPAEAQKTTGCFRQTGESRLLRKMKNSGNEAKEYLKTKDITFFNAANFVRFARQLTAI
jgi:hypothetical protein